MLTVGIDPGLSGALAALDIPNQRFVALPIPTFEVGGKRSIDDRALFNWLIDFDHADSAVLEHVHAFPGQGVVSMFNFGTAFGACRMALAASGVPYSLVRPAVWKSALGVPADKDGARMRATQLMPWCASAWSRKKDHNVAEAALLAFYAAKLGKAKAA